MPEDRDHDDDAAAGLTLNGQRDPDLADTARLRKRVRTNPLGIPAVEAPLSASGRVVREEPEGKRRGRRRRHMSTTGRIETVADAVEGVEDTADVLDRRVDDLTRRLHVLETLRNRLLAGVGAAVLAAAGAVVAVAKGLYDRGERDGVAQMRLQYLEREVFELRAVINGDRGWPAGRHPDAPDPIWPARRVEPLPLPSPKGTAP